MSAHARIRVLTPEGEILKVLIHNSRPRTVPQIVKEVKVGRTAVYDNIKDLIMAGLVVKESEFCKVTLPGVKAYFAEVLPGVDVDALVGYSKLLGVSALELVEVGVRVVMAVVEAAYIPADLARLLGRYDPSVLERLEGLFSRRGDGGQARAAEVVA